MHGGQDRPEYAHCQQLAEDIANLLAPQSGAYYDVWLDGEKFFSAEMEVGLFMPALCCQISVSLQQSCQAKSPLCPWPPAAIALGLLTGNTEQLARCG